MASDNIFGVLGAMLSLNDGVTSPTTPFGAPPQAGLGGATNSYQQAQAPETTPPPEIYQGTSSETVRTGHPTSGTTTKTVKSDSTSDPGKMLDKFSKSSPENMRKWALLLSLGGFNGEGSFEKLIVESFDMSYADTVDAYDKLLYDAAIAYVVHKKKVTPEEILRRAIAYKMPTAAEWDGTLDGVGTALGSIGIEIDGITEGPDAVAEKDGDKSADEIARKPKPFVGTKTTTSTSTVRDIMDPADAKALTRSLLQRELGRDPTEEEFADFIGAVQYAQKTNPSVSTTKNSYRYEKDKYAQGGSRMVEQSSNTTTRSGIGNAGIADIALQKARANPNWAEWQAVGTYAPALFEALGATVAGR